uniref:YnbE-like lipoprotein n=1 Tax=Candidatus Kentrum sp. DK TaxID=2126562 RepID=A0A450TID4_9GAMM|nr:MAG: YnbE-like lipoprotein [Candidatus Kentron sp. DK]VFJ67001.1 MAG: YnbE-like lipoprotein [Candidatus Kentron sp. DK]
MNKNNDSPVSVLLGGALSQRAAFGLHGLPVGKAAALGLLLLWQGGCSPTVRVETPEKPITINLNVKIEHEVRVRVDRELDALMGEKSDIF